MLRRRFALPFLLLLALAGISVAVSAQLETADRGILPIDSSGTLEITGIHVDLGGADAQSARYAGWRGAPRPGFCALWGQMHKAPIGQAPRPPGFTPHPILRSVHLERGE